MQRTRLDGKVLGTRLREARTEAGLTQKQAAQAVSVSRTTMVAIEQGDRRVQPEELVALATLYGVSVHSLAHPGMASFDFVTAFRGSPASREDGAASHQIVQLMGRLATSYVEIERQLNRPLHARYPLEYRIHRGSLKPQAEDVASQLRHQMGVGITPIPDIVSLVELELGLRVFIRGIDSRMSGAFAYHEAVGAVILLNAKHPRERRAWTLAHEIGHLLVSRTVPEVCYVTAPHESRVERFCDLFAAAFLMPAIAVRQRFDQICADDGRFSARHLIVLAHTFYVSLEAMCRRLEDLELLPAGTFDALKERGIYAEARSLLGDSVDESRPAVPPRLAMLAAEAHDCDLLSEGQLADMLALDRLQVRELLDTFANDEVLVPADARM
ncbi:MAG: XRE family transcriptional regulator [Proteobacteria bacterium]|nr:XRE family transcriptional regulator [Pseudomonadota bacterium]